jgi:hypothetical protein
VDRYDLGRLALDRLALDHGHLGQPRLEVGPPERAVLPKRDIRCGGTDLAPFGLSVHAVGRPRAASNPDMQ